MKRTVIACFCLVLWVPFAVSAQEAANEAAPFAAPANETEIKTAVETANDTSVETANETSLSAGFEFGNTIEHGGTAASDDVYFGSPGINIEGYSFWNGKNFGVFYHGAWTLPVVGDDAPDFQGNWLIGPAFRVRFTDKVTLQTGIGIGANSLYERFEESGTDYFRSTFNLGVGADAGLKFDITDKFFIKGGVNAAWSFLGWTNIRENERHSRGRGETDKNIMDIWTLTVNPYISFGVNIYSPKREIPRPEGRPRLGKPPREEAAL